MMIVQKINSKNIDKIIMKLKNNISILIKKVNCEIWGKTCIMWNAIMVL